MAECDPDTLQISGWQCNHGLQCNMQNAAVKFVQFQKCNQSWGQVDLSSSYHIIIIIMHIWSVASPFAYASGAC